MQKKTKVQLMICKITDRTDLEVVILLYCKPIGDIRQNDAIVLPEPMADCKNEYKNIKKMLAKPKPKLSFEIDHGKIACSKLYFTFIQNPLDNKDITESQYKDNIKEEILQVIDSNSKYNSFFIIHVMEDRYISTLNELTEFLDM